MVVSGNIHGAWANDLDALEGVRELMGYLPLSNKEKPPRMNPLDPPSRVCSALDTLVPTDPSVPYDMHAVIRYKIRASGFRV